MPRRRPKTRLDHIAHALQSAGEVVSALNAIDLRTTSGDLRAALRESRSLSVRLCEELDDAIKAEPILPPQRARTSA